MPDGARKPFRTSALATTLLCVLLGAQLPAAVLFGMDRTFGPWFLAPLLYGAMPCDALVAVGLAVGTFTAVGRGTAANVRLHLLALALSVVDVVAILWAFRDI